MDIIHLILLACAISDPNACREYRVSVQSSGSLQTCAMQAEPYLAEWAEAHPGYRVVRWRCAWPEQEQEKM